MEQITNCPACESSNTSDFLEIKDHSTSGETFSSKLCNECTLVFTSPRPSEKEIGKYYESTDYISHTNKKETLFEKAYHFVREIAIKQKFRLVSSFNTSNKILDYGCGTGDFLNYCKINGWKATGAEPNSNARNVLKDKSITALMPDDVLKTNEKFGIITMWHVLEHVHKLNELLQKCNEIIEDNGKLIIAVPNYTSYDAKYYKEYWAAYDMPIHLYHFSPKSIKSLLLKHGFKIEKTLPMVFDSFYVSLLSEKYKKGNAIKAGIIGFVSNVKGFLSKEDKHSSQIYVFSKN